MLCLRALLLLPLVPHSMPSLLFPYQDDIEITNDVTDDMSLQGTQQIDSADVSGLFEEGAAFADANNSGMNSSGMEALMNLVEAGGQLGKKTGKAATNKDTEPNN